MTKLKKQMGREQYTSPECVEIEVFMDGAILSASTGINASQEGYDVDNDEFNW